MLAPGSGSTASVGAFPPAPAPLQPPALGDTGLDTCRLSTIGSQACIPVAPALQIDKWMGHPESIVNDRLTDRLKFRKPDVNDV
jgi:hypothetical protein